MEKYYEIKEKHPDYLLIFRNADFWEMYANDATIASRVLKLDNHLTKLIRSGIRVALCE